MTVKTRITVFIVGAGFIASLLFSVVVFLELIEQPFDLLDSVLKEEAYRVAAMAVNGGQPYEHAMYGKNPLRDRYWVQISRQKSGQVVYRSPLARQIDLASVPPGKSAIAGAVLPSSKSSESMEYGQAAFRVRTFAIALNGTTYLVQIGRLMQRLEDEIRDLGLGIVSGLILSTMVLVVISRLVTNKILQPIGTMKDLAQDISEKNLDQRIPVGNGRDEFSELARTVNTMLDRLQYSFTKQREFLFDTSHELKTPLTTMRLAIDQVCAPRGEQLPAVAEKSLQRLNSQVLRMERLVKDLLNISALETHASIDAEPVHIHDLLASLIEEYQFLAQANAVRIEVNLPEGLVVPGERTKLFRAFSNLLDNAVKYNHEGGRVEVSARLEPEEAIVQIANTGPGVEAGEVPQVFNQFYRVEKSRSLQYGGSGLGLAMVKRIVELHSGQITFESRPGEWTWVTVRLPRQAGKKA